MKPAWRLVPVRSFVLTVALAFLAPSSQANELAPANEPRLSIGEITTRGPLSHELVEKEIRRRFPEAGKCFQADPNRKPIEAGTVSLQVTVGANGQVLASTVAKSTLSNTRAETCLSQAARHWEFRKTSGGGLTMITCPYLYEPGQ